MQDFSSHLIETATPEFKQLILFLLESVTQLICLISGFCASELRTYTVIAHCHARYTKK